MCNILPVTATITFNSSGIMSPKNSETYMCRLTYGMDCWKQTRLHELCHKIEVRDVDLYAAEEMLQEIEESDPL